MLPKPLEGSEASHDLTQRQTKEKNPATLFLNVVAAIACKHVGNMKRRMCDEWNQGRAQGRLIAYGFYCCCDRLQAHCAKLSTPHSPNDMK